MVKSMSSSAKNPRSPITTHVLDISRGKPAANIHVTLQRRLSNATSEGVWSILKNAETNSDGRIEDLLAPGSVAEPGVYSLTFELAGYFLAQGQKTFYPTATIVFEITNPKEHHHVPLLLSPYGYSTYRGT
jgi:hydroxyisourate hydrolase